MRLKEIEFKYLIATYKNNNNNRNIDKYKITSNIFLCFTSTAHALYNNFSDGKSPYLSTIDYLLVDEAGQVSPELGAHASCLSKK